MGSTEFERLVVNLRPPEAEWLGAATRDGTTRTTVVHRALARDRFIETERSNGAVILARRPNGETVELWA